MTETEILKQIEELNRYESKRQFHNYSEIRNELLEQLEELNKC